MPQKASAAYTDSKPHYELLDGLRGVAALLVIWYHVFEGFAFAGGGSIEHINHGYLAVDFFFMLSGFVIAYAYDDRWSKGSLTTGSFFKRRLIRLHPMVVLATVIGVVSYLIQGGVNWEGTKIASGMVVLATVCMLFFIPAVPGARYDVRGNGEMFPLNGPSWSLFFEYIGNILYALFIRRLSDKALTTAVVILGICLIWFTASDASGYGMFGVGWTLDNTNFFGGMLRMLFPFTMGMLIQRRFRPLKIRGAFWICSAILYILLSIPYVEGSGAICLNGVYEAFCIICVFPLLILLGASGETTDRISTGICKFLGDISYPVYIIHYPLMYLFYAWLIEHKLYTLGETWPMAVAVCLSSIILAYISLKTYDEPVRKWLTSKIFHHKSTHTWQS